MTSIETSASDTTPKAVKAAKRKSSSNGLRDFATGRSDILLIDPRRIEVEDGFNSRDFTSPKNLAHVAWLEGSIASEGVKEPLKVRLVGSRILITNGESRLRAVKNLIARGIDIQTVPVRQEDRFANDLDRLFTQHTSNSGKTFEPLEQSSLFRKMLERGATVEDISQRVNMDKRRVTQILDFQTLPTEIQSMIKRDEMTVTLAMQTFVDNDRDEASTIDALTGAIQNAKAAGRKRASPKFLGGTGGERKKSAGKVLKDERAEIVALFEGAFFDDDQDTDGAGQPVGEVKTIISMSKEKAERLKVILGL